MRAGADSLSLDKLSRSEEHGSVLADEVGTGRVSHRLHVVHAVVETGGQAARSLCSTD